MLSVVFCDVLVFIGLQRRTYKRPECMESTVSAIKKKSFVGKVALNGLGRAHAPMHRSARLWKIFRPPKGLWSFACMKNTAWWCGILIMMQI